MSIPLFRDGKTELLARVIRRRVGSVFRRLLVVGCGSGLESAILARELRAEVVGLDMYSAFDPTVSCCVHLCCGDATRLPFCSGCFDFVYSYHALEHIPDYRTALSEMNRVLCKGGGFCIGTPNRTRVVGYLGSKDATLAQKIKWNLDDLGARLRGRFRNEFGAHAGYSSAELAFELEREFGGGQEITLEYYLEVYRRRAGLIKVLGELGLGQFCFPSIYFAGVKRGSNSSIPTG